jgi:Secretion system C-terminal sorting domain
MRNHFVLTLTVALLTILFTVSGRAQPGDNWLKAYDLGGNDSYRAVASNDDNGQTLIAVRDGEIEMVKLDRFGEIEWRHGYAEVDWYYPHIGSLLHTADGGYSFRYQDGNYKFLVHTDQYGRELWRVDLPDLGLQMAERDGGGYVVASTPNNHAMLTLTFLDQNGSIEYDVEFDPMSGISVGDIKPDGLGNYYIFTIRSGVGSDRAPVFKVDGSGNLLWMQFLPEFDFPAVQCLGGFVTDDGGCVWYGAGHEQTGLYFFDWAALAARLPADGGDPVWMGAFEEDVDGTDDERFVTGVAGADGHIYLAGDLAGYPAVLEIDGTGNEVWRYVGPRMENYFPQYYYFGATFDDNNESAHFFGMDSEVQDALQHVIGQEEPAARPNVEFEPVGETSFPPAGGTLTSTVHIENLTGQAEQVRARRGVVTPSGTNLLLDDVMITLTSGQIIDINDHQQEIPAYAPAGEYVHYVTLLDQNNQKLSSQAYFFTKDFAAANASGIEEADGSTWQHGNQLAFATDVADEEAAAALPQSFIVSAAYPNPFNPSTRFSVTLTETQHIHAVINDVNGRQIAELANSPFSAGTHSLTFAPSSLSSGTYFLQVSAGQDRSFQKLVYLK